ncbi:hypothetical protein BC828DRAFT_387644 [Blastocladiella britannica]|nr:hypothetical protein BC828DRAFT_387644 [Blastocladiella britannica]
MNTPLVLDRILVFAAHRAYTLRDGLELLNVSARSDIPTTYSHIVRRLVPKHALGEMGRIDLLNMLEQPLSAKSIENIATGASQGAHIHVLEWTHRQLPNPNNGTLFRSRRPEPHAHMSAFLSITFPAIQHAHFHLLEWFSTYGPGYFKHGLSYLFSNATLCGQVLVLAWLRAYAIQHKTDNLFEYKIYQPPRAPSAQHVAMLDWWKADYVGRPVKLFPQSSHFPHQLAWSSDDGLLLVDWWRTYCAETGCDFSWPVLNPTSLGKILKDGSISLCQWWWEDTVRQRGIGYASTLLMTAAVLDAMCEYNRVDLLDWFWDLCAGPTNELAFPPDWRPKHPFSHLRVIQWFENKVADGLIDAAVIGIELLKTHDEQRLDVLFWSCDSLCPDLVIGLGALDWWWARRDRFGLEMRHLPRVFSQLATSRSLAHLHWYLDHYTADTLIPPLTLQEIAGLVSRGRADLADQVWRHPTQSPLISDSTNPIDTSKFADTVAVPVVLDYLWEHCGRAGETRAVFFFEAASVRQAAKDNDLDSVRWWDAMRRVHGTA